MRSVFYPHLVNGPFGDPALYVRLAHRGKAFLFDCGDLHPLTPRDALKISAVFVSHAHIDHLAGFDALLRLFLYREPPLLLHGPPGFIERVGHKLSGYTWNLIEDYPLVLTVREWGNPGREAVFRAREGFRPGTPVPFDCPRGVMLETPDLRVRAVPLDHGGIVSLAFALEETLHVAVHRDALDARGYPPGPWLTAFKDRLRRGEPADAPIAVPLAGGGEERVPLGELASAIAHVEGGMKIAYVTDVSPTAENGERIVALARDAHLLVIEATFSHAELERARTRNHLTARMAGDLARRAGVSRLLVFHHSPRYQDEPGRLAEEARSAFDGEAEGTGGCA